MTRLDAPPGRPRERIVGAVIVVVGVAVLVLSLVALLKAGDGPSSDLSGTTVTLPPASSSGTASASGSPSASTSSSASSSASTSSSASSSSSGAIGSEPLVVLNNTKTTNLASDAAATFKNGGWTVSSTGNISQDILSTCAYYDPDVPGAQAAAEALMAQFPAIKRTKEKFGALPAGPVVVVLTSDYTAQ